MSNVLYLPVPYEGYQHYLVGSNGTVFSIRKSDFLKGTWSGRSNCQYRSVQLWNLDNTKPIKCLLHKLVYITFYEDVPPGYHVDHIDRNRDHNWLDNLRLVTISDNMKNRRSWKRPDNLSRQK